MIFGLDVHPGKSPDFDSAPGHLEAASDDQILRQTDLLSALRVSKTSKGSSTSSTSSSYEISKLSTSTRLSSSQSDVSTQIESIEISPLVPSDDGYLALGTIHLLLQEDADDPGLHTMMQSPFGNEQYPNPWITMALRKGWIRLEQVNEQNDNVSSRLRVYVLPEDIDRGNRASLKDFRKVVKHLLRFVDRSTDAWLGKANGSFLTYNSPTCLQEESIFYIFNTLQSPCPNLDCFQLSTYGYQAVSDVMNESIAGLKSVLYPYQRRSVATMIQRETEPAKILDPRKPITKDLFGTPFYLDVNEGALLQNPTLYTEPQGGILAETMGYGKTLICIALILATRGHYPKVPEDRVDSIPFTPREKVGSLLAMAARRTKHEGVPWKAEFDAMTKAGYHFERCIAELKKYHREYAEPIFTPTTPERKGKRDSAYHVRLCSATLIIVPPNLLVQWQNEIQKHTDESALDVLTLDSPTKEVPSWKELLQYDIVLITKARFEQEYRDDDLHQGKSRKGEARYRSPLTDLRWLRVICDEGHGFAGSTARTNAMAMLDKMYIERRWVVSGTPSSTLHGVEVGLATSDSALTRKESLTSALKKRRAPNARDLEIKDLERLRLIVVNFLRLQPWANQRGSSDVANWKKYLTPFTNAEGHPSTSPVLRDVLQTLIIRHRIEDIDTDLTLPPLHNRIVYLDPSYHDKLAINMFFLVLTSNYVTSEREDEDYMFHPRNRKKLDQLISNLRQATFHWVGFSEHDIRETLRISNEYLDKNIDRISDSDGVLLTEAVMNGERALADPSWKAFSTLHEIGVYVNGFPEHARESWALDGRTNDPVLLGTVQARETQKYMRENYCKKGVDALSGFAGAGVKALNAAKSRAEDEQRAQQNVKAKVNEGDKQQVGASEEPRLRAPSTSLTNQSRLSSNKRPISGTPKKRRRSSSTGSTTLMTPPSSPSTPASPRILESPCSEIAETTISSFTSSKLTYLLSRLLSLPPGTKSLIFYQHNNTAFFIAEALELFSIPFRIYANTLSVAQRNAYLADFNSDTSDIRILLMDVKQASHGLHVACASYVCIVSPIWDAGVESQAIKRAHRIGQTQEVVVETLVLRDTFEEEMVRRRRWKDEHIDVDHDAVDHEAVSGAKDLTTKASPMSSVTDRKKSKSHKASQGKSLLDDRHMVNVIKDIKFLKFRSEEHDVGGRVTEMDVPKAKRLLFNDVLSKSRNADADSSAVPKNSEKMDANHLGHAGSRAKFRKLRAGSRLLTEKLSDLQPRGKEKMEL